MKNPIIAFSNALNLNPEEFFAKIKAENKAKKWSLSPVVISLKDGQLQHNAQEVAKLVNIVEQWADKEVTEANLSTLEDDRVLVSEVLKWFKGSRIQLTKPFDELKKSFTEQEKRLASAEQEIKNAIELMHEQEYAKREETLRALISSALEDLKHEQDIELKEELFEDFISKKRKTKILTDTGKPTAKIIKEANSLIDDLVTPILKEREEKEKLQKALNRVELETKEIMSFDNDNLESMNVALSKINKLIDNANIMYEDDVVNAVKNALYAKQTIIINAIENYKKLEEANADAKADEELLNSLKVDVDENSIEELESALQILREAYPKARLKATQDKITNIANGIKARLEKLKKDIVADAKKEDTIVEVPKTENKSTIKKYKVDLFDLQVLASMTFEAENEDDAKYKILSEFKLILENIKLKVEE